MTSAALSLLHPPSGFDRWQLPTHVAEAVWRGDELGASEGRTVSTGHKLLDQALPGNGWPTASLCEVLQPQAAVCEWRMLAPALPGLLADKVCCLYLVAPPKQPSAIGLAQLGVSPKQVVWITADSPAERLWVTEQLLKSDPAGAVLSWLPQARPEQIRRLQVHAQNCDAPIFLFRPETALRDTSPAPLRLSVRPGAGWNIDVQVRKRRGASLAEVLHIPAMPGNLDIIIPPRLLTLAPLQANGSEVSHAMGRTAPRTDRVRVAN